jgi:Tfp pilus assembly protein PilF
MLYPYPDHWPVAVVAGAGLLLAGVSAWALRGLGRRPYLAVGWFWFLGTLVPVIGLVQDGRQAMADRYMYVPSIGLLLVLCWGAGEIIGRATKSDAGRDAPANSQARRPRYLAAPIAALAILGCGWATRHQLQYWRNSVALFGRAVAVTQGNYIAQESLGIALVRSGAIEQAGPHFAESLRLQPERASVHFNLGLWLTLEGKPAEAAAQYREAIRLRPKYPKALNNLAWILATGSDARTRNGEEALQLARRATDLTGGNDPEDLDTLAAAWAETHQFAEAVKVAERAAGLAQAAGHEELARQIQSRLRGYRSEQPAREP